MLHDEILVGIKKCRDLYVQMYQEKGEFYHKHKKYDGEYETIFHDLNAMCTGRDGVFYFDHIMEDSDLLKTGFEFLQNDLLTLPYDECLFIERLDKKLVDKAGLKYADGDTVILWAKKTHDGFLLIPFAPIPAELSKDAKKDEIPALPLLGIPLSAQSLMEVGLDDARMNITSHALLAFKQYSAEDLQDITRRTIMFFVYAVMLLYLPHYDKTDTEISEKLLKAREKRGKAPLRGYTTVKLKKAIHDHFSGGSKGGGWTVKPHWRRGHIRVLPSGKLTKVRPHMVNWEGDADLEKNVYKVKE